MTTSPNIDLRHLARSLALLALYEIDSTSHTPISVLESYANMPIPGDDARITAYMALHISSNMLNEDVMEEDEEDDDWDDASLVLKDPELTLTPETYQMMQILVTGVLKQRDNLDQVIAQHAPEWPLDQIAIIDRNILRIAIHELTQDKKLPVKVVINEAVEIAKLFGAEGSPRFINGVLGSITDEWYGIQPDSPSETTTSSD
ncbi:MAG: transcription antitermination factor NusB [Chloroflexi bacterium]|nr:transcription antitermination factor NusB [Chloroflexota bacterium]